MKIWTNNRSNNVHTQKAPLQYRATLHRTRWKALAEIYTKHSFAPFFNLNFFVKNRQNFFAIELMNIH